MILCNSQWEHCISSREEKMEMKMQDAMKNLFILSWAYNNRSYPGLVSQKAHCCCVLQMLQAGGPVYAPMVHAGYVRKHKLVVGVGQGAPKQGPIPFLIREIRKKMFLLNSFIYFLEPLHCVGWQEIRLDKCLCIVCMSGGWWSCYKIRLIFINSWFFTNIRAT